MSGSTEPERVTIGGGKGPNLEGSVEALRRTTIILEVLSGLRGPTEGAKALDINQTHYYALEARALQGMLSALERRPPGRRPKRAEERVVALEAEVQNLNAELARALALVRQAQRTLGLREASVMKPAAKRKKGSQRRGKPRATKVAERIQATLAPKGRQEAPPHDEP